MSRIEKVSLKCESLSMQVRGSLNIPEALPSSPSVSRSIEEVPGETFSPTDSVDSGRWTGTALWPSNKYFVYGGPGFSIGILDSTNGCLERLPIPVPTLSFLEAADASNFSLSEVTCLTLAGESQVWAGTEAGSLHVFDLSMQYGAPRLMNHGYSRLPEAVSCLRAEQLCPAPSRAMSLVSRERRSLVTRTEVLVGSANNTLTVISGEADERGGLRNVAGCPRKVIHLQYRNEEGGSCNGVHSIALVSQATGLPVEYYWCACGPSIVILRRSNWKILKVLEQSDGLPSAGALGYVSHLEPTDYGVWCTVNLSPIVTLWDTKDLSPKLKIPCVNAGPEALLVDRNAQVTCLAYCDPLLLVGTRGGCLLILSIQTKRQFNRIRHCSMPDVAVHSLPSSPRLHSRKLSYTVLTSSHCYPAPITSIHPIPVQGGSMGGAVESPYLCSPSNALNMLIVFSTSPDDDVIACSASESVVQVYELTSSPLASPMTSPNTAPGRSSTISLPPSSSTNRKCSLQDLDTMPKLSLYRVSNDAISYLPLHENPVW